MKKINRLNRISKILKKEIAIIIQKKVKDPRLNIGFSISHVKLSHDFSYAKVFFTYLDHKDILAIKNGLFALNHASIYIRTLLSKSVILRSVPILNFFYDDSLLEGNRIYNLIKDTIQNDLKNKYIRSKKEYKCF